MGLEKHSNASLLIIEKWIRGDRRPLELFIAGRVRCSAWSYARHALAELLGKRDDDALRPADIS